MSAKEAEREKGRIAIGIKLNKAGVDIDTIKQATGLKKIEINKL